MLSVLDHHGDLYNHTTKRCYPNQTQSACGSLRLNEARLVSKRTLKIWYELFCVIIRIIDIISIVITNHSFDITIVSLPIAHCLSPIALWFVCCARIVCWQAVRLFCWPHRLQDVETATGSRGSGILRLHDCWLVEIWAISKGSVYIYIYICIYNYIYYI